MVRRLEDKPAEEETDTMKILFQKISQIGDVQGGTRGGREKGGKMLRWDEVGDVDHGAPLLLMAGAARAPQAGAFLPQTSAAARPPPSRALYPRGPLRRHKRRPRLHRCGELETMSRPNTIVVIRGSDQRRRI